MLEPVYTAAHKKAAKSTEIQSQIEAFKASGGTIRSVPYGVMNGGASANYNNKNAWISENEAARMLCVSVETLVESRSTGKLMDVKSPACKAQSDGSFRYPVAGIERWYELLNQHHKKKRKH